MEVGRASLRGAPSTKIGGFSMVVRAIRPPKRTRSQSRSGEARVVATSIFNISPAYGRSTPRLSQSSRAQVLRGAMAHKWGMLCL